MMCLWVVLMTYSLCPAVSCTVLVSGADKQIVSVSYWLVKVKHKLQEQESVQPSSSAALLDYWIKQNTHKHREPAMFFFFFLWNEFDLVLRSNYNLPWALWSFLMCTVWGSCRGENAVGDTEHSASELQSSITQSNDEIHHICGEWHSNICIRDEPACLWENYANAIIKNDLFSG